MPEVFTPLERLARKNAFDASLTLGTASFNLATGRDRHREQPLSSFVDPKSGLIKEDLAHFRPCPVCASSALEILFVKDGFTHGRCLECGLIYVNPVLREEALLEHYRQESSWVQVLDSDRQVELDRLKYAYALDLIKPYAAGKKLLDLGAGTGLFAQVAGEKGWDPVLLELHRGNADRLRKKGFQVIETLVEKAGLPPDSFDLITLWEVLEHVVNPGTLLTEIYRILKFQGLLLILVPNADALVSRLLHEKSGTFGGHSHVNFFNLKTLSRLLANHGFIILEAETIITELGTINNYLNFEDPYLGSAGPILDFLTPEFIHGHLLGSRLLVLAAPESFKENP